MVSSRVIGSSYTVLSLTTTAHTDFLSVLAQRNINNTVKHHAFVSSAVNYVKKWQTIADTKVASSECNSIYKLRMQVIIA